MASLVTYDSQVVTSSDDCKCLIYTDIYCLLNIISHFLHQAEYMLHIDNRATVIIRRAMYYQLSFQIIQSIIFFTNLNPMFFSNLLRRSFWLFFSLNLTKMRFLTRVDILAYLTTIDVDICEHTSGFSSQARVHLLTSQEVAVATRSHGRQRSRLATQGS